MSQYKCWRSVRDKHIHLLCHEGSAAFDSLPPPVQELDPWQGSKEGAIADLRLPYRLLLGNSDDLEHLFPMIPSSCSGRSRAVHDGTCGCVSLSVNFLCVSQGG